MPHSALGVEALDGANQALALELEDAQERLTIAGELLVDRGLAVLNEDADVEAKSMEVDTAGTNMLSCVESQPLFFL